MPTPAAPSGEAPRRVAPLAEHLPRDVAHDPRAVARIIVRGARAAVLHASERSQGVGDGLVRLLALEGGDEADAARARSSRIWFMSTAPPVYGARDSIAERTWPERGAAAGEAGDSERNLGGRKGGETGVREEQPARRDRGGGVEEGEETGRKKKRPRARQGTKARRLARQPGDVRRSLFDGGGARSPPRGAHLGRAAARRRPAKAGMCACVGKRSVVRQWRIDPRGRAAASRSRVGIREKARRRDVSG